MIYGKGRFSGAVYDDQQDHARLTEQLTQVYDLMRDGQWRTPEQVAEAIGAKNVNSVSAQLRNLRKVAFGGWHFTENPNGHLVARRFKRGVRGYSEYQLILAKYFQPVDAPKSLLEAYDREMQRLEAKRRAA